MVRQKDNLFLFLFVPDEDTPQMDSRATLLSCSRASVMWTKEDARLARFLNKSDSMKRCF
jgi:hypothetical protein